MSLGNTLQLLDVYRIFGIVDYFEDLPQRLSVDVAKIIPTQDVVVNQVKRSSDPFVKPKPIRELIKESHQIDYSFLDKVSTLDDLKEAMESFDGCVLKKTALSTVLGDGNENADLMLIGEGPGADEDEMGIPFVGRSGQLLIKALGSIDLQRKDIFISNTVFWRPPGNRNPTFEEMAQCYPIVLKIISIIKPKVILLVGKVSAENILKTQKSIGQLRSKWFLSQDTNTDLQDNIKLKAVYHPAYLLRSYTQKRIFWEDMINLKKELSKINEGSKQ